MCSQILNWKIHWGIIEHVFIELGGDFPTREGTQLAIYSKVWCVTPLSLEKQNFFTLSCGISFESMQLSLS